MMINRKKSLLNKIFKQVRYSNRHFEIVAKNHFISPEFPETVDIFIVTDNDEVEVSQIAKETEKSYEEARQHLQKVVDFYKQEGRRNISAYIHTKDRSERVIDGRVGLNGHINPWHSIRRLEGKNKNGFYSKTNY